MKLRGSRLIRSGFRVEEVLGNYKNNNNKKKHDFKAHLASRIELARVSAISHN